MGNKFLTVSIDETTRTIRFALGNGQAIVFNPDTAPDEMRGRAMFHGFNQRIRDAASGFSKGNDYEGAYNAMTDVVDAIYNGEWNRKGVTGISDLVRALANLAGKTVDEARTVVDKMDDDMLKKLKGDKNIAAEVKRLQADRAAQVAKGSEFDLEGLF